MSCGPAGHSRGRGLRLGLPGGSERDSRPISRVSAACSGFAIAISTGRPAGQSRAMLLLGLLASALLLVACHRGNGTDILPAPTNVRFLAETFRHLLLWEPGRRLNRTAELSYDVQYQQYGSVGWTPAPHCTRLPRPPCDLSLQAGRPDAYYYARVRAVAGGSASNWTLSPRFSPKEATLHLLNVTLSLHGNTIRVLVRPPLGPGASLAFQDLYAQWAEFHAHVRSSFDNRQFVHVGSSLEFDLPPLAWGHRYCVRVQPHVSSRPLPAKATEEQCVSIPALPQEGDLGPSLSLLSLVPLGLLAFGLGLAWAYVKKPVETPGVLVSLQRKQQQQHPSPEGASEESPPGLRGLEEVVLRLEREAVQPLCFLGLEGLHPPVGKADRPMGLATPPLGKGRWRSESPRLWKNVLDTSRGSTDSGICLQDPSDNLSFSLDAWKLSLGSHERDSGFQVDAGVLRSGEQLPAMASESKERLPLGDPPKTCFSTYQSQSRATLGVAVGTGGVALAEPGMATGYLKQASLGVVLPARDFMGATPTGVLPSHPNLGGLFSGPLREDASSPALDVL